MFRSIWCAVALAMAPVPAQAQESGVSKLREELRQLQQRVQELEKRLEQAETAAAPPAPQAGSRQAGENAFNPGISVILQGTAARSSEDPEGYRIGGFAPSGGEVKPARRGFSLGESELFLTGSVDPLFRGQLVASLSAENEAEVEEAFFQTIALGQGFTLKGGRFLSAIGYQNEIHQHAWDFQDAPLAYKAFLGGRLNDDAVQLRWLAPTDLFVELGTELGRGRSFPASDMPRNGAGAWTAFGHVGGDMGNTAWRTGLSYLHASPRERSFDDSPPFSGASKLWIADFVLKWAPGGNAQINNFKLQGEYFRRHENGDLVFNDLSGDYRSRQSGWYLAGVYQFMPQWRAGYRYDRLSHGAVTNGLGLGADDSLLFTRYNPTRSTFMVDWSPTEFSRVRLQLAADKSRPGVTDRQALIQYVYSLGAHGAHRF